MGAWGYGLFQSDAELDFCSEICVEAATFAQDPELDLLYPEDPIPVVTKLNNGLLDQLLTYFVLAQWDHAVIYIGALALQLGAHISVPQNVLLRKTLKRTPMYDEAKAQMQKGLVWCAKNKGPYNFGSLGVEETIEKKLNEAAERNKGKPKEDRPMVMINVPEDYTKWPKPKPKVKATSKENLLPKDDNQTKKKERQVKKEREQVKREEKQLTKEEGQVKVKREEEQGKQLTGEDELRNKNTLKAWVEDVKDDGSI